jgi:hypothetical protein
MSTRVLLWVASAGRDGEPTPDVHLYLYDRYWRLAEHHRSAGHVRRAATLHHKAETHYRKAGHDDPPFAAAMALPLPRPRVLTRAVARRPDGHDDAA